MLEYILHILNLSKDNSSNPVRRGAFLPLPHLCLASYPVLHHFISLFVLNKASRS